MPLSSRTGWQEQCLAGGSLNRRCAHAGRVHGSRRRNFATSERCRPERRASLRPTGRSKEPRRLLAIVTMSVGWRGRPCEVACGSTGSHLKLKEHAPAEQGRLDSPGGCAAGWPWLDSHDLRRSEIHSIAHTWSLPCSLCMATTNTFARAHVCLHTRGTFVFLYLQALML